MTRIQKSLFWALVVLLLGGGAGIYTLVEEVKTPDERRRLEVEEKRLFHFGRIEVIRGQLISKTGTIAFARSPLGYQITSPVDWPAEPDAIEAMLDRMTAITIEPIITEDATAVDLAQTGLDHPPFRLKVELKSGASHTLQIGKLNRMSGRYPATDEQQRRIGLTSDDAIWAFQRQLSDFRQKRLFPLSSQEIVRVEARTATPFTLDRVAEGWKVGPEPGDRGLIDLYLTQLTVHLKAERFLDDQLDDAHRAAFGLAPPLASITVTSTQGRTRRIDFGAFQETGAPDGTLVAWVEGTRSVVALPESFREVLAQSPETMRDRTIARYNPSQAARLEIRVGEAHYAALKQSDGRWKLDEAQGRMAEAYKINSMINGFSGLRANAVVTGAATARELEKWRLQPAAWQVVVKSGTGQVLADVRLGDYASDDELYAKGAEGGRVYRVPDGKAKMIPKSADELAAR